MHICTSYGGLVVILAKKRVGIFGQNLDKIMYSRRITINDLENFSSVSQSIISRILDGSTYNPRVATKIKLVNALGWQNYKDVESPSFSIETTKKVHFRDWNNLTSVNEIEVSDLSSIFALESTYDYYPIIPSKSILIFGNSEIEDVDKIAFVENGRIILFKVLEILSDYIIAVPLNGENRILNIKTHDILGVLLEMRLVRKSIKDI
jgi:transcriptional regulator with XRE-family HTH domain